MVISAKTYEQVALEDGDAIWELECGRLREKPGMTTHHNRAVSLLHVGLAMQLDPQAFVVRSNSARLRIASGSFYVPDVCVIPSSLEARSLQHPQRLEVYEEPMPLVVEVWSPSTGDYDVEVKLATYQERGDAEIWRLHPYERTLTAWRRQADGTYAESLYREGVIEPVELPGVRIDLAALFS
jgi:Uma2 family endonuclease